MLQQMRKMSKSWVSSIFLGLLALSFGMWGIADIFTGNTDTAVASVGKVKISVEQFRTEYQNRIRNESNQRGTTITNEQAHAMGLGQDTLQSLISRAALDQIVQRHGLTLSDEAVASQIRGVAAFNGPLGTFDRQTFQRIIADSGFTEQTFIAAIRSDGAREQLLSAVRNGFKMPAGYVRALFSYLNEARAVHYVVMPASAAGSVSDPDDKTLAAYEKAHANIFSTPEYRQLTYASVSPADVRDQVKVTDEQIKQEYEVRRSQYRIPEKRDIEQITFKDEASAKAAKAKIDAGTSFETIATERKLKPDDIKLGTLVQADLGEDRGKAAFALNEGGVSAPIKSSFGYVLLHVTKITPEKITTLEEATPALKKEIADQLAAAKIVDVTNAYEDAASGGANLAEAAQKAGMHVHKIPAVDAQGMTPDGKKADVPDNAEFMKQVFAADIGMEGDPFQVKDGTSFVLKVDGVTPPKLKPLDSVRVKVAAMWQAEQRKKQLEDLAKKLSTEAEKSGSLESAAKTLGVKVQQSDGMLRNTQSANFSPELMEKIFAVKPASAIYGNTADGENFVIALVTGVAHPNIQIDSPELQSGIDQLSQQMAGDFAVLLATASRNKLGVTINQKNVETVIGENS